MKNGKQIKSEWAAITITDSGAVIVGVKSNGTAGCVYFESADVFRRATAEKKIYVKNWAVCVPRNVCIFKKLSLPVETLDEAAQMVEFELGSLLPIPPKQIIYGCTSIALHKNLMDVLVSLLKTDTLNSYLQPYRLMGVAPARIVPSSMAIHNWFLTAGQSCGAEIIAVVDNRQAEVICCIENNLSDSTKIAFSDRMDDSVRKQLAAVIVSRLQHLPASSKNTAQIVISAADGHAKQLKSTLKVFLPDDFAQDRVITRQPPQFDAYNENCDAARIDDYAYEAVMTAGLWELASNHKLPNCNLISREQSKKHLRIKQLSGRFATAGLSGLLLVMLWVCLWAANFRINRTCRQIEARIAPIQNISSEVEAKRQKVKAIINQLSNRGEITAILEELYKYSPPNISISEMSYTQKLNVAQLDIKAQADVLSNAFGYTESMREAKLLKNMQIENAQQVSRQGSSIVEFRANCVITGD